jgi:hypothetical protein
LLSYILGSCLFVGYILLLISLFKVSEDGLTQLVFFVYAVFALPYAVFSYFRSGKAIPRTLFFEWHSTVIKSSIRNPIVPAIIALVLVSANRLYEPPQLSFSQLERIDETLWIQADEFASFSQELDSLQSSLQSKLSYSNSWKSDSRYQIFYYMPPQNYSSANTREITDNYWSFKRRVIGEDVTQVEIKIGKKSEELNSFSRALQALEQNLINACSEDSSEFSEEFIAEKLSLCNKLESRLNNQTSAIESIDISSLNSDLSNIRQNISTGKKFLQDWNNWIAAVNEVVDLTQISKEEVDSWLNTVKYRMESVEKKVESTRKSFLRFSDFQQKVKQEINRFEDLFHELETQVMSYEDASSITRGMINDAQKDLSLAPLLLKDFPEMDKQINRYLDELASYQEDIRNEISNLFNLAKSGDALLAKYRAGKFRSEAEAKVADIQDYLQRIDKASSEVLEPLSIDLEKEINKSNNFYQDQIQKIQGLELLSEDIQNRLDFFIQEAERSLVISRIKWLAIFVVVFGMAIFIFWYQRERAILRGKSRLENQGVQELLDIIENSKKFVAIRKEAVQKINDYQDLLEYKDVSLLKKAVKQLEVSTSEDDIKVNAELRSVTESLELRLMERRGFS